MTDKQKYQFNKMRTVLRRIMNYQSPPQLRRNSQKQYGIGGEEAIEMAYENIINTALNGVKGIRAIK